MKKILLSFALVACTGFAFAQDDFSKSMTEKIEKLQTTEQADDLGAIAYEFDRMIEKNDSWLPYYYTAYAYLKQGKAMVKANKLMEVDNIAAVAEKYAMVAQEKNSSSAEVFILLKMIHNLKIMVDPSVRYAAENELGNKALEKAKKLDPKNPRISISIAENLFDAPKEFGGSKDKALLMYQNALDQFKTYKPASSIDPNWGEKEAQNIVLEFKK